MPYEPEKLARADQYWAEIRAHLDGFIEVHAEGSTDIGNPEALDRIVSILKCPHLDNGMDVGREQHALTLASLLACAIDQLAALKVGAR
jgi:hypothetical protein